MTTTEHPRLARIRALLATAESLTGEASENYRNKALQLIAEHGIDEALAFAEQKTRDEIIRREIVTLAPYSKDKGRLLHNIAVAIGATTIRMVDARRYDDGTPLPKNATKMLVYGYEGDVDRIELLFTSLLVQGTNGMINDSVPGWTARETMANRRVWLAGFTSRVRERLEDLQARAQADAQERAEAAGVSTALVLADRRSEVQKHFEDAHPDIRKIRSSYSGSGYGRGRAAGDRADLGQTRVGGTRKAIR